VAAARLMAERALLGDDDDAEDDAPAFRGRGGRGRGGRGGSWSNSRGKSKARR